MFTDLFYNLYFPGACSNHGLWDSSTYFDMLPHIVEIEKNTSKMSNPVSNPLRKRLTGAIPDYNPWWKVCQLHQRSLAWHTANVVYFGAGELQSLAQEKRTSTIDYNDQNVFL